MKKVLLGLGLVALALATANLTFAMASHKAKAAPKGTVVYTCDQCHEMAMQPGKCPKCGMEMTAKHVLAVKDGMVYMCTCGKDCTCEMKGDDMTKCTCGKPIVAMSAKGMYVCDCGPTCKCTTISDKPGKCSCGKDLKKVE